MKQTATMGNNRTGVDTSEGRVDDMQKGSQQFEPSSHGTTAGAGKVRVLYAKEADEKGLGSVPPPNGGTAKGKVKAGAKKLTGAEPTLLMDKMGERLAFERTGTRLYEALVSKHEAFGSFDGGPSRAELIEILNVWARFIYGPLMDDRVRAIADGVAPAEYGRRQAFTVHQALKKKGPLTVPREFVLMDRAAIGLGGVFIHLKAELNFYRLFNEALEDYSPAGVAARQSAALAAAGLDAPAG